jgi:hypothetical protein
MRVLGILAAAAGIALATPVALASPTPSPPLGGLLIAPSASDLTESDQYIDGPMSAERWAHDNTRMLDELRLDNFVAGYGRTFASSSNDKLFLEVVGAFDGAKDAKRFLTFDETSPSDDYYDRPLLADTVVSFVGAHYADTAKSEYWDAAVFVKGNDLFDLYAYSKKNDLGDLVTTQAQRLFDAAPRYTIPPSQWPENAASNSLSSFSFSGAVVPFAIGAGGILVVGLLVVALVVFMQGRGRGSRVVESRPEMSPDGRYWWDGQAWRDAEHVPPPSALRSADGYYWWDGTNWRRVPAPAPVPVATLSPN